MKAVLERNLGFLGYPNYSVDTDGNVWSLNYKCIGKAKVLRPNKATKYQQITLCYKGVRKTWMIHKLVALAFIPNPENKPCIDHINCDRTDNRVINLRWCTYSENNNNPITRKRKSDAISGEKHWMYGKRWSEEYCKHMSDCIKKIKGKK